MDDLFKLITISFEQEIFDEARFLSIPFVLFDLILFLEMIGLSNCKIGFVSIFCATPGEFRSWETFFIAHRIPGMQFV